MRMGTLSGMMLPATCGSVPENAAGAEAECGRYRYRLAGDGLKLWSCSDRGKFGIMIEVTEAALCSPPDGAGFARPYGNRPGAVQGAPRRRREPVHVAGLGGSSRVPGGIWKTTGSGGVFGLSGVTLAALRTGDREPNRSTREAGVVGMAPGR